MTKQAISIKNLHLVNWQISEMLAWLEIGMAWLSEVRLVVIFQSFVNQQGFL